jgi:3-isopropylmalate/(R)-2-methylmalate dehydratase large subunit
VAVVAHQGAGIELVVADSFQRIFQENMVYGGMPFTTDRAVLERLARRARRSTSPELRDELPPFFRAVSPGGRLMREVRHRAPQRRGHPTYDLEALRRAP